MNREELKRQAASRRSAAAEEVVTSSGWSCGFCNRPFATEGAFMRHKCPQKLKLEELRSPTGQTAYACYSEWMKAQKRSVPPIETFATSQKYSAFMRFAQHIERVHVPNVPAFIRFMVESDVPPVLWARDNVYSMYMKLYDEAVKPQQQVEDATQLLAELVLELKVEPESVYAALGVDTMEDLIKRRKLTFWFLLASTNFKRYLQSLDPEDRDRLANAMHAGAAVSRIQQEPELFKKFASEIKELGL